MTKSTQVLLRLGASLCLCNVVTASVYSVPVATDVYGVAQGGVVNGIPTAHDDNDPIPDINDAINLLQGSALARNVDADPLFVAADEVWTELNGTIALIGLSAGFSNTAGVYTDLGVGAVKTPVLGPYSGDPTWDFASASFMSVLTYATAPWAVGVMFRALVKKESIHIIYPAVCLWMFSASWSYDLYILIRDDMYPLTWYANLIASSFLYFCGGLFWNLSYKTGRGVHFAFTEDEWPEFESVQPVAKIIWFAMPFVILIAGLMFYFALFDSA